MGGQACVLYGAAQFSRDIDLAVLADASNLERLHLALAELQADTIAIPGFEARYLDRGLAVHFRCHHPDVEGLRIDLMSRMRGVDAFPLLWERRTSRPVGSEMIEVLSLPDLVLAKKTQRDKHWPMLARLVDVNYYENAPAPNAAQIEFWLRESRTPQVLVHVAQRFPEQANSLTTERPLLQHALGGDVEALSIALHGEEVAERELDRRYWLPLKQEIERLRLTRRSTPGRDVHEK